MSVIDNKRMIIRVCKLYYEQNMSQKEISFQLGISRPQISRILAHAKDQNIVSVKINNPFAEESEIEKRLVEQYKLRDALVVNTNGLRGQQALDELGKQVSEQLETYISDHDLVGVMSGKTISAVVKAIDSFNRKGVEFIPLIGGIGSSGADWHANVIAQNFADKVRGKYYLLNSPVIVNNLESKALLMREPHIGDIIEKSKSSDVAIVGIGQVDMISTTVQSGALSIDDVNRLKTAKAVASICTSYVDVDGKIIENEITERSLGLTLEELRECKQVIAIAIGNSKIEAIKAVLLSGYIDVFITNIDTAYAI
jgi:DNA-binding transcriptional regulator LsrR (DeoR family)